MRFHIKAKVGSHREAVEFCWCDGKRNRVRNSNQGLLMSMPKEMERKLPSIVIQGWFQI